MDMRRVTGVYAAMLNGEHMTHPHYAPPISKKEAKAEGFEKLFLEACEERKKNG